MSHGGEGGIRTLASFYTPRRLAISPLQPLGYLSERGYLTQDKPRRQALDIKAIFAYLRSAEGMERWLSWSKAPDLKSGVRATVP